MKPPSKSSPQGPSVNKGPASQRRAPAQQSAGPSIGASAQPAGAMPVPPTQQGGTTQYSRLRDNYKTIDIDTYKLPEIAHWVKLMGMTGVEKGSGVKTHPVASGTRRMAESHLLYKIIEDGPDYLVDLFGSERTFALFKTLIRGTKLPTEYVAWRPDITAKDVVYSQASPKWPRVDDIEALLKLATDTYQVDKLAFFGCDLYYFRRPDDMADLIESKIHSIVDMPQIAGYFCHQVFHEDVDGGLTYGESPYRREHFDIVQMPHVREPAWPGTYVNDWWKRQTYVSIMNGLTPVYYCWSLVGAISSYELYKVVRTTVKPGGPQFLKINLPDHALVATREIAVPPPTGVFEWFVKAFFFRGEKIRLQVFLPGLELVSRFTLKSRETFQISNVQTELVNIMNQQKYKNFWDSNLFSREDITAQTMKYLVCAGLCQESEQLDLQAVLYGSTLANIRDQRKDLTKGRTLWQWVKTQVSGPWFKYQMFSLATIGLWFIVNYFLKAYHPIFMVLIGRAQGWLQRNLVRPAKVGMIPVTFTVDLLGFDSELHYYIQRATPFNPSQLFLVKGSELTLKEKLYLWALMIIYRFFPTDAPPEALPKVYGFIMNVLLMWLSPHYEEKLKEKFGLAGTVLITAWELSRAAVHPLALPFRVFGHYAFTQEVNPRSSHFSWNTGATLVAAAMEPSLPAIGAVVGSAAPLLKEGVDWRYLIAGLAFTRGCFTARSRWFLISIVSVFFRRKFVKPFDKLVSACNYAVQQLSIVVESVFSVFEGLDSYRNHNVLQDWKNDVSQLAHIENDYPVMAVPPEEAYVPAINGPHGTDPDAPEATVGFYILLSPSNTFVRPTGIKNFEYAYEARNVSPIHDGKTMLVSDLCEGEDPCTLIPNLKTILCPLGKRWASAVRLFDEQFCQGFSYRDLAEEKMTLIEWIAHYNEAHKRARARQAVHEAAEAGVNYRNTLFLKGDEVIYPRGATYSNVTGTLSIKARTITSVDTTVQATCAPELDMFFTQFKKCIERDSFILHQPRQTGPDYYKIVKFAVGSGKNGAALNDWFMRSLEWVESQADASLPGTNCRPDEVISCIVAGDDFFALAMIQGKLFLFENDFSKFDRTEGAHALFAELEVLMACGVPNQVVAVLAKTFMTKFSYQNRKLMVKQPCPMPLQRPTGGPNTTTGNSIVNIVSTLWSLKKGLTLELDVMQRKLGLLPKLQIVEADGLDHFPSTFLKGWWVDAFWVPLPSLVCKLGKILTDPCSIHKKIPSAEAWRRVAKAMALGVGTIPVEYPVLGPLLYRYLHLTDAQVVPLYDEFKARVDYTISSTLTQQFRESAMAMMCQRYDIEVYEILDLEELILKAPFPGIICHRVLKQLAARDYG